MKRIEDENSKLTNQVKQIQTQLKSQAIQVNNLNNKLKEAEEKLIRWGFNYKCFIHQYCLFSDRSKVKILLSSCNYNLSVAQ